MDDEEELDRIRAVCRGEAFDCRKSSRRSRRFAIAVMMTACFNTVMTAVSPLWLLHAVCAVLNGFCALRLMASSQRFTMIADAFEVIERNASEGNLQ